jgi:hypothetical protein
MFSSPYHLNEDELKSFRLLTNGVDWDDIAEGRREAIEELLRKYPDISDKAIPEEGTTVSSTMPLSQQSTIPDMASDVETESAREAYHQTHDVWQRDSN